ncbi:CHAP domain-containing protein [Olsenella sp. An290]|uniref:coiled-coil domain-containing protein n=1 Tax=Olsenella sp. An290 TaxID=1965625 RepID=UPI000B373DB4|nr:CHAP domain-containing protein [Olsenella sp. An290]OUO32230.1 hypothetical protein B5F84_09315 [Olsenella sp. An290]
MSRQHVHMSDAGITPRSVTRRDALRLFMGAGLCATFFPALAGAETTQEKLDAAQMSYEQAQEELARIAEEYSALATQAADTHAKLGDVTIKIGDIESDIEDKQDEIDRSQRQIESKQEELGERMTSAYKSGRQSTLELLLSSASFEELTSNIYYLDKVSESEKEIIEDVKSLKAEQEQQRAELEEQKAELEDQKAELEDLQAQQQEELEAARAKQEESQELVDNLSAEVQQLMEQRDAELLAAQQAAEEARRQQELLAQQSQQRPSGGGGSSSLPSGGTITGSGPAAAVISATYSTPSPGSGLCAAWVTNVFQRAGIGSFYGNADDMYYAWCWYPTSQIQPGMIVAVNSSPASAAGRLYGHIGIYVGNGMVRDNIGYVNTQSLSSWVSYYSALAVPRCGWLGGIALS